MLVLRMPASKAILPTLPQFPPKPQPPWRRISQLSSPAHLRLTRPPSQLRSFAHQPSKPSSEALKRQAKPAAPSAKNHAPPTRPEIPQRILIYHAGTGKIAFLAALKLTTLLLGAFFTLLAARSSFQAGKPTLATAAVAACGIVPALLVASSTAPFVTHMHMHLPAAARASPASLARFVAALPPGARLTLTTMSFVATPRHSAVCVGDLRAARPRTRLGLVNYQRDAAADNAARRWYMYRPVGAFYLQDNKAGVPGKQSVATTTGHRARNKAAVDTWIWDAVRDKIARRDAPGSV